MEEAFTFTWVNLGLNLLPGPLVVIERALKRGEHLTVAEVAE